MTFAARAFGAVAVATAMLMALSMKVIAVELGVPYLIAKLICAVMVFVSLNLPSLASALAGGVGISSMVGKLSQLPRLGGKGGGAGVEKPPKPSPEGGEIKGKPNPAAPPGGGAMSPEQKK